MDALAAELLPAAGYPTAGGQQNSRRSTMGDVLLRAAAFVVLTTALTAVLALPYWVG